MSNADEATRMLELSNNKDCIRDTYKNIGCHGCPASDRCDSAFMDYAVHCVRYSNAWDIRFKW